MDCRGDLWLNTFEYIHTFYLIHYSVLYIMKPIVRTYWMHYYIIDIIALILYNMVDLFSVFFISADKVIAKNNNEVKFDNFIPQATSKQILTLIPGSTIEKPGFFGFGTKSITVDDTALKDAYLELYDYLVKYEIITKQVGASSIFTWDSVYTINQQFIKQSNLEKIIKKSNTDFPELLKCFNIDYKKLSDLLTNYNYSSLDEVDLLVKGGKRKQKKNKTKRKSSHKNRNH